MIEYFVSEDDNIEYFENITVVIPDPTFEYFEIDEPGITIFNILSSNGGGISSPELLAIAALTSVADTVAYFTGFGTAALAAFTAAGRALVGLVGATADTVPYFTGSGTAALTAFTAAGRTFLAAISAAAQRAAIGADNAANLITGILPNLRLSSLVASRLNEDFFVGFNLNPLVQPASLKCEFYGGIQTLYGDGMVGQSINGGTIDIPVSGYGGGVGLVRLGATVGTPNSGYMIATPKSISLDLPSGRQEYEVNARVYLDTANTNFRAYIGMFEESLVAAEPTSGIYLRLAGIGNSKVSITGVVRQNNVEDVVFIQDRSINSFVNFRIIVTYSFFTFPFVTNVQFNSASNISATLVSPANYPGGFMRTGLRTVTLGGAIPFLLTEDFFRFRPYIAPLT